MEPNGVAGRVRTTAMRAPVAATCNPFECGILREADHRIANNLALLASFVNLQAMDAERSHVAPTRQGVRLLLRAVLARIEMISHLHRLLATRGAAGAIDLGPFLHDLCAPLVSALSNGAGLIEEFTPGCVVGDDQILPIAQIVAEAVTNAIKYAHPSRIGGSIVVGCRKTSDGTLLVEIADDGGGLPDGFDPATDGGLGFRVMRGLAAQIGATLVFESRHTGLRIRVSAPRPREAVESANVGA